LRETGLWVKRLQVQHHRAANDALEGLGLTIVQWDALRHLDANPGASLHGLAQLTFQTDQSMGALATRLIARGLIERLSGPGRAVRHELTATGKNLYEDGAEILEGVLAASFAPLTKTEIATFDELLQRLVHTRTASAVSDRGSRRR
jgi:DNA-binding MarR family transcriptional regulator